jgi:rubrerythrin
VFEEMAEEERGHRHRLLEMYEQRFGPHLPPIRREDVKGFLRRRPIWLTKNWRSTPSARKSRPWSCRPEQFYIKAAETAEDVGVRRLLGDLAEEEKGHEKLAAKLTGQILSPGVRAAEDKTRRRVFVLQYVQPGSPA